MHLSQGTLTGILQRLEQRGLVTRQRSDTDRRAIIVEITPEGRKLVESAPSLLQDRFLHELEQLQDWERTMILATLQRVAGLMGAEQLDASPHLVNNTDLASGGAQTHDLDSLPTEPE